MSVQPRRVAQESAMDSHSHSPAGSPQELSFAVPLPGRGDYLSYEEDDGMIDPATLGGGNKCVFTPRMVQTYWPSQPHPEQPWVEEDLLQDVHSRHFSNPKVETEFLKFSCRDAISIVVAFAYCLALGTWPIFFGESNDLIGLAFFSAGALLFICTIVLFVCHFYLTPPKPTDRIAHLKSVATIAVGVISLATVASLPEITSIECYNDQRTADPHVPNSTGTESLSVHCVDRVNGAFVFAMVGVTLFMRLRAVPNLVCAVGGFTLWATVYFGLSDTERMESISWQKHLIKTMVYLAAAVTTGVMGSQKDRVTRYQFKQNIRALIMRKSLEEEKQGTTKVLQALLPLTVITRMVEGERIEDPEQDATVFFSDIKDFTEWSSTRSPLDVVKMVSILCAKFDAACDLWSVEKVKTIGDAYWAVCGLPTFNCDHAENVLEFALACVQIVGDSNSHHPEWCDVQIRVGVHTGPVNGGVLGSQQLSYEIFGETNDVAKHVEAAGVPGRVCCTAQTKDHAHTMEDLSFTPHKQVNCFNAVWETFIVQAKGREIAEKREQRRRRGVLLNQQIENDRKAQLQLGLQNPMLSSTSVVGGGGMDASEVVSLTSRLSQTSSASNNPENRVLDREYLAVNKRRERRNSKISQTTGQSMDELRTITMKFMKNRRNRERDEANAEIEAVDDEQKVLEMVINETQAKWRHVLYTYANPKVEADYMQFSLQHVKPLRQGGSVMFVVFCVLGFFSILLDSKDGQDDQRNVVAALVAVLACVCASIGGAASFGKLNHNVAPVVGGLGCTLLVAALALLRKDDSAPIVLTEDAGNVLANDPGWVTITLFVVYGFTNSWLSYTMILLLQVASVGIPLAVGYRNSSYFGSLLFVFGTLVTASLPTAAVFERSIRQQFEEYRMFRLQLGLMEEQAAQSLELVSHTIPDFIAPRLREWITKGQDLAKPLSVQYSQLAVCFINFEPPSLINQHPPISHPLFAQPAHHLNRGNNNMTSTQIGIPMHPPFSASGSRQEGGSGSNIDADSRSSLRSSAAVDPTGAPSIALPAIAHGGSPPPPPHATRSQRDVTTPSPVELVLNWNYMCDIQTSIEEQLSHFKSIVKIKTIGNVTMLAGPVNQPHGHNEAAIQRSVAELVSLSLNLRVVENLGNVRVGLHIGPVQGVVLGIERMTYDILGSTVNHAARYMTATKGQPSDVLASDDFVTMYNRWKDTKDAFSNSLNFPLPGEQQQQQPQQTQILSQAQHHRSSLGLVPNSATKRSHSGLPIRVMTPTMFSSSMESKNNDQPSMLEATPSLTCVGGRDHPFSAVKVNQHELHQTSSSSSSNNSSSFNKEGVAGPGGAGPAIVVEKPGDWSGVSQRNEVSSLTDVPSTAAGIEVCGSAQAPSTGSPDSVSIEKIAEVRRLSGVTSCDNTTPGSLPSLLVPEEEERTTTSDDMSASDILLGHQQLQNADFTVAFNEDLKGLGITTLWRVGGMVASAQERRTRAQSSLAFSISDSFRNATGGGGTVPAL